MRTLIALIGALLLASCALDYHPVNATVAEAGHPLRITYQDGKADLVHFHDTSWEGLAPGEQVSLICNRTTSRCQDALLGWNRRPTVPLGGVRP